MSESPHGPDSRARPCDEPNVQVSAYPGRVEVEAFDPDEGPAFTLIMLPEQAVAFAELIIEAATCAGWTGKH